MTSPEPAFIPLPKRSAVLLLVCGLGVILGLAVSTGGQIYGISFADLHLGWSGFVALQTLGAAAFLVVIVATWRGICRRFPNPVWVGEVMYQPAGHKKKYRHLATCSLKAAAIMVTLVVWLAIGITGSLAAMTNAVIVKGSGQTIGVAILVVQSVVLVVLMTIMAPLILRRLQRKPAIWHTKTHLCWAIGWTEKEVALSDIEGYRLTRWKILILHCRNGKSIYIPLGLMWMRLVLTLVLNMAAYGNPAGLYR